MSRANDSKNTLNACYTHPHSLRNKTSEARLMVDGLSLDIIVVKGTWLMLDLECSSITAGYIYIRIDKFVDLKAAGIV